MHGFPIVLHFLLGSRGQHSTDEILERVQAHGRNTGNVPILRYGEVGADQPEHIPGERGLQTPKLAQPRRLGCRRQELLRAHVEQLGSRGQAGSVVAVGTKHRVVDVHLLGDAVDGGARGMHARGDTLAIVGAQPLVSSGNVDNRRIELPAENCGKRFAQPFKTGSRRSVLERNHDQRATRCRGLLGVKCRAEDERRQQ